MSLTNNSTVDDLVLAEQKLLQHMKIYNSLGLVLSLFACASASLLLVVTFWKRTGAPLRKKSNTLLAASAVLDVIVSLPLLVNHIVTILEGYEAPAAYLCFRRLFFCLFAAYANRALLILLAADRLFNFHYPMQYKVWPRFYYVAAFACVAGCTGFAVAGLVRLGFALDDTQRTAITFCSIPSVLFGKPARVAHFLSFLILTGTAIILYATQQLANDSRLVAAATARNLTSRVSTQLRRFSLAYEASSSTVKRMSVTSTSESNRTDDLLLPLTIQLVIEFVIWLSEAFCFVVGILLADSAPALTVALYAALCVYGRPIGRLIALYSFSRQYKDAVQKLLCGHGGVSLPTAVVIRRASRPLGVLSSVASPGNTATGMGGDRRRSSTSLIATALNYLSIPGAGGGGGGSSNSYHGEKRGSAASIISAISMTVFGASASVAEAAASYGSIGKLEAAPSGSTAKMSTAGLASTSNRSTSPRRKSNQYLHLQTKPMNSKRHSVANLLTYL